MGTIKYFDRDKKEWRPFASDKANQIFTNSEDLVNFVNSNNSSKDQADVTTTDVENVMKKVVDNLHTLNGNVSWLSLHGGGGSGGGGNNSGAAAGNASITVNGVNSDDPNGVILNTNTDLSILVQSSSSSLTWDVTVQSGTKSIAHVTGQTSGSPFRVKNSSLLNAGLSQVFKLTITAYNSATLTYIYWTGTIYISNVVLSTRSQYSIDSTTINEAGSVIVFTCNVGLINQSYELLISRVGGSKITKSPLVFLESGKDVPIEVHMSELISMLDLGKSVAFTAVLRSLSDQTISSKTISFNITITSENIIISALLSSDKDNPIIVNQDKSIVLDYVAYRSESAGTRLFYKWVTVTGTGLNGETITTGINVNKTYEGNTTGINDKSTVSFNTNQTLYIPISEFEVDSLLTVKMGVWTPDMSTAETGPFYVKVAAPSFKQLPTPDKANLIMDLLAYGAQQSSSVWNSTNTKFRRNSDTLTITGSANVGYSNSRSGIINSTPASFRLQNRSYATIQDWTLADSQVSFKDLVQATKEFTINICYKCDYHPDNDRTIFQLGKLNSLDELQSGILVTAHKVEVKAGSSGSGSTGASGSVSAVLMDQEIINLTITYSSGKCYIYVNGVVEKVDSLNNFIVDANGTFAEWLSEPIYLGCSYNRATHEDYFNFADVSFFRIMAYKSKLNDLQILFNYLNNLSYSHYNDSGTPDKKYINDGLQRNFITFNEDSGTIQKSFLWDVAGGSYDVSEMFGTEGIKESIIKQYSLPIPLMFIDVSGSSEWTWANFTKSAGVDDVTLSPVGSAPIQYYDNNILCGGSNNLMKASISIQGTSTLADRIKNLNITFQDDSIFIPKKTWMPEKTYTLKADIVDSSHSTNAAIGKFVNDHFGLDAQGNSQYPFNSVVKSRFLSSQYHANFPSATLKHAIEGFPVFVVLRCSPESPGDSGIHTLGIYQFLLGRSSERNLGYKILSSLRDSSGNEMTEDSLNGQFPVYRTNVGITETSVGGYWIEANENLGIGGILDDGSVNGLSVRPGIVTETPSSLKTKLVGGMFWQNDSSYVDRYLEIKYKQQPSDHLEQVMASSVSGFDLFMNLALEIQKLDITRRHYTSDNDKCVAEGLGTSYEYNKYTWNNNRWVDTGTTNKMTANDENIYIDQYLNLESAYKYFCIANLFGLCDNFMKNLPFKFFGYGNADGSETERENAKAIIGIYDCDTGLGGNNQGGIDRTEDLWILNLKNFTNNYLTEYEGYRVTETDETAAYSPLGLNSIPEGWGNKLWYSLMGQGVGYKYFGSQTANNYADTWTWLRNYLSSSVRDAGFTSLADYFIDKYFEPQTEGCGELLFNLTYKAKYIDEYTDKSGVTTNQLRKLNGRRIMQARRWLKHHITFLDSVFDWYRPSGSSAFIGVDDYQGAKDVNIIASNGLSTLPIQVDAPVVMTINAASRTVGSYCRTPRYGKSQIYFGVGNDFINNDKPHVVKYSDNILELGSDFIPLSSSIVSSVTGPLPMLTKFDLSGSQKLTGNNAFNIQNLFTSSTKDVSELRVIDLSNTKFSDNTGTLTLNFNIVEDGTITEKTKFQKLQEINLSNSCVTSVTLPRVPLAKFTCDHSKIETLNLQDQNFLNTLDLSGCANLSNVVIASCSSLGSLTFGSDHSNLSNVTVQQCQGFEEFTCTYNNNVRSINLLDCSTLKTVTIKNCTNLTSVNLAACKNLERINLEGCTKLTSLTLPKDTLPYVSYLNISSTEIGYIKFDQTVNTDILDLSSMTRDNFELVCYFNSAVRKIQFKNIQDYPVHIKHSFRQCPNIERVYGNITLDVGSEYFSDTKELVGVFQGCANFTVHGPIVKNQNDYGSVYDHVVRMPYEVDSASDLSSYKVRFLGGALKSNISFNTTKLYKTFQETSVTTFDIYYLLTNIGPVKILRETFRGLYVNPFSWTDLGGIDNSPHRNMFWWCGNVTSIDALFFNIQEPDEDYPRFFRVFSPTEAGDDGLFSPLVSLTSMSEAFVGYKYVIDKNCFRRSTDFKITDMTGFNPVLICDGINDKQFINLPHYSNVSVINDTNVGNLDGFFTNLPNLTSSTYDFLWSNVINYSTISNIPSGVTKLVGWCVSKFGKGTLTPSTMFVSPSSVEWIVESFRVLTAGDLKFPIGSSTLSPFTNLVRLGYLSEGYGYYNRWEWLSSSSSNVNRCSFCGPGLNKYLTETTFPYNIVSKCQKLEMFAGFFSECKVSSTVSNGSLSETLELPGTMFISNPELKDISSLFYNLSIKYTLVGAKLTNGSWSGGFSNCNKLENVSFLFGAEQKANNLSGSIPRRLFYCGTKKHHTDSIYGLNLNVRVSEVYTPDGRKASRIVKTDGTVLNDGTSALTETVEVNGEAWYKVEYPYESVSVKVMGTGETNMIYDITKTTLLTFDGDSTYSDDTGTYSKYLDSSILYGVSGDISVEFLRGLAAPGKGPIHSITSTSTNSGNIVRVGVGSQRALSRVVFTCSQSAYTPSDISEFSCSSGSLSFDKIGKTITWEGNDMLGTLDFQVSMNIVISKVAISYIPSGATQSATTTINTYKDSVSIYVKSSVAPRIYVSKSDVYYMTVSGDVKFWDNIFCTGSSIPATSVYDTEILEYDEVYKPIKYMIRCFSGVNTLPYTYTPASETDYEGNEDFMPFNYAMTGTTWTQVTRNNKRYTEIWNYDGVHSLNSPDVENLDEPHSLDLGVLKSYSVSDDTSNSDQTSNGTAIGETLNFICAPDIFRYCSQSTFLASGLFEFSGHNKTGNLTGNAWTMNSKYGLRGRIIPYMLKPVSKVKSLNLDSMFRDCKMISPIHTTDSSPKYYVIPSTFFDYSGSVGSLSYTFSGMVFPYNTDLNVFVNKSIAPGDLLKIDHIFYKSVFHGTPSAKLLISGIFKGFNSFTDIRFAFAYDESYVTRSERDFLISQYVKFSDIFTTNKYNVTTSPLYNSDRFSGVFICYSSSTAEFGTKTLNEGADRFNYKYYGTN